MRNAYLLTVKLCIIKPQAVPYENVTNHIWLLCFKHAIR